MESSWWRSDKSGESKDDFKENSKSENHSFDDMGLRENLLRGIYAYGFEYPSRIQSKLIVPISERRDVLAQSQSGTGKTAAFVIGILQQIDFYNNTCQALIICPARELATQVFRVLQSLGDYLGGKYHLCVGGTSVGSDIKALKAGVQVVVGMTGRIGDMIKRNILNVDNVKIFVLDEADDMLGQSGKVDQVYEIYTQLPKTVQTIFISSTITSEVMKISNTILKNPLKFLVEPKDLFLEGIQHYNIVVPEEAKLDTLAEMYEFCCISQTIVFAGNKRKVEWISDQLTNRDFTIASHHGDLDMDTRTRILNEFRTGSSRFLLATDILSRGIDVHALSFVINYDMPSSMETYLHRVGRCGRFGRKGIVINFVIPNQDEQIIEDMKKYCVVKFEHEFYPDDLAKILGL